MDAKKLFRVALANRNAFTTGFFSSKNLVFFVFLEVSGDFAVKCLIFDLCSNFKNFSSIKVFVQSGKNKLLTTLFKFDKKKFHLNQLENPNFEKKSTFDFCKNLVLDCKFIKIGFIKFDS
jgi:hypothetical protein